MPEFSSHTPGTFSWAELSTSDQRAGVAFYRSLFGWDAQDSPVGPDEVYTMFTLRGLPVAAGAGQRPDERQQGVPPHWNLYITVASADETVGKAQALGGSVLAPAFDVMDVGRMAVLQDPTGAVFCVWEPRAHIGAHVLAEPGALCWTELGTRDTKAAEAFYTGLFGWVPKHSAPGAPQEYTEFSVDGRPSIGMMPMPAGVPAQVPAHWTPYFQVADCDASAERVRALGGSVIVPPSDIPTAGRFAVVSDPQGAMFAMFKLARE